MDHVELIPFFTVMPKSATLGIKGSFKHRDLVSLKSEQSLTIRKFILMLVHTMLW